MAKKTQLATAANLKKLNWYYLQRAMYAAWHDYDQPATKQDGLKVIHAVYDEYARRGVAKCIRPVPALP